ncbi:hypothetical protein WDV93_11210 [Pantoea ananatis]
MFFIQDAHKVSRFCTYGKA